MGKYIFILILIFLFLPQAYYFVKKKEYNKLSNGFKFFVKDEEKISANRTKVILTNADGFDIYTNRFDVESPKGIVQIIHGIYEHSANYWKFIDYLNQNGYSVIVSDNRGHGKSVSEKYPSGYMKYLDQIIDDQVVVNKYMKMIYPNLSYYMLGHSFGSMVSRLYLQEHDESIDKLILTGTVGYIPISGLGVFIGNIIGFYLGEYRRSYLLDRLTGMNGKDISWVSYNKENIERKSKDILRLKYFMARANVVLIEANKRLHDFKKFKTKNKTLKILSLTGVDDKVVLGEKGLYDSINSLKKVGYENINYIVYENMKHEVLCETDYMDVFEDIIKFLEDKDFLY